MERWPWAFWMFHPYWPMMLLMADWWWHTTVLSLTVRQNPKLTPGNKQGRDKDSTFNHSIWSLLDNFIPFGVTGRVLEPVPSAYGWRKVTPLNESPAHPYVSIWGFSCCTRVARQCSEGVLAAFPSTTTPKGLNQERFASQPNPLTSELPEPQYDLS